MPKLEVESLEQQVARLRNEVDDLRTMISKLTSLYEAQIGQKVEVNKSPIKKGSMEMTSAQKRALFKTAHLKELRERREIPNAVGNALKGVDNAAEAGRNAAMAERRREPDNAAEAGRNAAMAERGREPENAAEAGRSAAMAERRRDQEMWNKHSNPSASNYPIAGVEKPHTPAGEATPKVNENKEVAARGREEPHRNKP